jgi:hypothetical protein
LDHKEDLTVPKMSQSIEINSGWKFTEAGDGASESWTPVLHVPGTIHTDLLHHGR